MKQLLFAFICMLLLVSFKGFAQSDLCYDFRFYSDQKLKSEIEKMDKAIERHNSNDFGAVGERLAIDRIIKTILDRADGIISEAEFNSQLLKHYRGLSTLIKLHEKIDQNLIDKREKLRYCLAQRKNKDLGIAYILKDGDPEINAHNIAPNIKVGKGTYYDSEISESMFSLHRYMKNEEGKTLYDWNWDFYINVDAPGVLKPNDEVKITVTGNLDVIKKGQMILWSAAKIKHSGFKQMTVTPEVKKKDVMSVNYKKQTNTRTWTLKAGEPAKELYLNIFFKDGHHTWSNKYHWIKDETH